MELAEQAAAVDSQQALVAFISALVADQKRDDTDFMNVDLGSFLEAMGAWIDDADGYYKNRGEKLDEQSPWGLMADALMAARTYE
ncbi:MAG TPA: hypothetical protein VGM39_24130 [Kofleriaceae bacterium]|jgi:hypothetical protein